jgi:hypothetical protein
MKLGLKEVSAALAAAAALNGCGANQNTAESPENAVDHYRAALGQLGTSQGVQVKGPFLESVVCKEGPQDSAEEFARIDANKALDDACAATAPGGFVPKMQGKSAHSGNVHCVTAKTPLTDTCRGE